MSKEAQALREQISVGDHVSNGVVGGRVIATHKAFAWITGDATEGPLTFPFRLLHVTKKAAHP